MRIVWGRQDTWIPPTTGQRLHERIPTSTLRLIDALAPDLVLLDIAMPGLDGMQVAQAVTRADARPAIVFVTAFDQFAIAAFDVAAVDYLLKPVAADRLARADERAAEHVRGPPSGGAGVEQWTEEFWVPRRSEIVRVPAIAIDRIEAERDYMRLHVGAQSYLLHQTISALERRLDPCHFVRLHRSSIVRRDFIARLARDPLGGWSAVLHDGTTLRIGRTYLAAARTIARQ